MTLMHQSRNCKRIATHSGPQRLTEDGASTKGFAYRKNTYEPFLCYGGLSTTF